MANAMKDAKVALGNLVPGAEVLKGNTLTMRGGVKVMQTCGRFKCACLEL